MAGFKRHSKKRELQKYFKPRLLLLLAAVLVFGLGTELEAGCPTSLANASSLLSDRAKKDGDLNFNVLGRDHQVESLVRSTRDRGIRGHSALIGNSGVGRSAIMLKAGQALGAGYQVRELDLVALAAQAAGRNSNMVSTFPDVMRSIRSTEEANQPDSGNDTYVLIVSGAQLEQLTRGEGNTVIYSLFEQAIRESGDHLRFWFELTPSQWSKIPDSLKQLLQAQEISPPSDMEMLEIVTSRARELSALYNVGYSPEAIRAAIRKANASGQPGSAVELITQAMNQLANENRSSSLTAAERREVAKLESDIKGLEASIAALRERQLTIESDINTAPDRELRRQLETEQRNLPQKITSQQASLEAKKEALRELSPDSGTSNAQVTADLINEIASRMGSLEKKAAGESEHGEVSLASFRVMDPPSTTFDDVGGMIDVKESLQNEVIFPSTRPTDAARFGLKAGTRMLLEGGPGNGKTLFAEAAANATNRFGEPIFDEIYVIDANALTSMWLGVGPNNVRRLFKEIAERAADGKRIYIFIDEFEVLGGRRGSGGTGGSQERDAMVNALLTGINGFGIKGGNVTIVAATNRADMLDPALRRPGRFDTVITVREPDLEGRIQILEIALRHLREQNIIVEEELDIQALAEKMEGWSGAMIKDGFGQAIGKLLAQRARMIEEQAFQQFQEQLGGQPPTREQREEFERFVDEQILAIRADAEILQAAFEVTNARHQWERQMQGLDPVPPEEGSQVGVGGER